MGWWEKTSRQWEICVVAQAGGAAGIGAGAFFIQFRSPDLPVRPVFITIAAGLGVGGSVGSAVSIPYRSVVRQPINPADITDPNSIGWNALDGEFATKNLNHSMFRIAQVGASVVIVGGQFALVSAVEPHLFSPDVTLFNSRITWPRTMAQVGSSILDIPQIQGGLGAGAFAFTGPLQYIGT